MKKSPQPGRKTSAMLTSRPYSMFMGSQQLRASDGDISISSGSSLTDLSSPFKSLTSIRSKLNSSAEFLASSIFYDNFGNSDGNNSADNSGSSRIEMAPTGPSASTWVIPKSIKKLPIPGNVFGVHIAKSGTCYVSVVSDKGDRQIQAYDRNYNLVKTFHCRAAKGAKPFEPYQIHETPDGCLAVASGTCVTVWSKEGKLVTEHGRNMFKFAKCLAVRSTGEIVVTDTDSNSVKIISANGQQINQLDADFNCPVGVAVDSNDNIIVSDWSDKIRIFDADNLLVCSFGSKGSNPGELDLPYGVSVDSANNIIVADMWNHRLSVYTQQGLFLNHLASDPGQSVRMPAHITVAAGLTSDDYRFAVTDFSANSVKIFCY